MSPEGRRLKKTTWSTPAERLAVHARRIGEPTTGSDFSDESGREVAKGRRHGSKTVQLGSFGVLGIGKMAPCVAGGSTRKRESDFPLRSEAVAYRWLPEEVLPALVGSASGEYPDFRV